MLLGIIFITKTLHKRTQSIQKTSVKEIQQFSNEKVYFCSLIVIFGVFGFFAFHDWLWKNSYGEKTEFFPYKNEKN
jgi:hypothetical protein